MTVDTTVTNGRFVGPQGIIDQAISIHDGIVLDTVELDDVWRTIDASGHLVLPGMIQPGSLAVNDVLQLARQGSTVVMLSQPYGVDIATLASPIDFLCCGTLDDPRVDLDSNKPVVAPTHPNALTLAHDGHAMLEVSASRLSEDDASDIWDVVADEAMPVHVTNGGITDFPLLPFLYHEGCEARSISPSRIAAVVSTIPAEWYGLSPHKGSFRPGSHGDVVVFDPSAPDPYRHSTWPGRVILSIQRGNILLYNGQLHTSCDNGLLLNE